MFRISNCLALSLSDSIQIRFRVYRRVRLAQIKKTGNQHHSWAGFDQKLSAAIFLCSTPGRGALLPERGNNLAEFRGDCLPEISNVWILVVFDECRIKVIRMEMDLSSTRFRN
ncbi:hypothetical protein CEXT_785251 [Caerostris extrusa]|uniref:Uncharacterized protein n=1 Tax=Caerostris extrusa TaxID=172846 RepID=A0AAV4YCB2_CAEEX|nr:hypothetical protein CEXT_785251 [Caerostris extrusa]